MLHLVDYRLADVGWIMAQQQSAVPHPVVDVAMAVHIPLVSTFGTLDINGEGLHASIIVGYPVGKNLLGACKELP
jgi:hypothetical protein